MQLPGCIFYFRTCLICWIRYIANSEIALRLKLQVCLATYHDSYSAVLTTFIVTVAIFKRRTNKLIDDRG